MSENEKPEKPKAFTRREKLQDKASHLQSVNAEAYHKANEKDKKDREIIIRTPDGKNKNKKVQLPTYKNGVVKSRLVSVIKS